MEIAKIEEGYKMLLVKANLIAQIKRVKTGLVDKKISRLSFESKHGAYIFKVEGNDKFIVQTAELYLQILEGMLKELNLKIMAL